MEEIEYAITKSGKKIPFVYRSDPPRGGMKHTYFSPDRSYVVQFFNDSDIGESTAVRQRLYAILGKYNTTLSEEQGGAAGNKKEWAEYFSKRFCWPIDIVVEPEFGIVCPTYPKRFFFDKSASDLLNLNGKDKKSTWYTEKYRNYLNPSELGNLKGILQVSFMLAQSVRRMHQAGLAHSDLSCNNVLIDPKSGTCIVIDIDSLVVPDIFPPMVVGTKGYIAPEVLQSLVQHRGQRVGASVYTDLYALAVLIYEYIFCRHPLKGNKVYDAYSEKRNYILQMGEKALFIENPEDCSNHIQNMPFTIQHMGKPLEKLFLRAFVEGLHCPQKRPTAMEWERGLSITLDLLQKCSNTKCIQKWFVPEQKQNVKCPFCGTIQKRTPFLQSYCHIAQKQGHWKPFSKIQFYSEKMLYNWHFFDNVYPNEKADKTECAVILQKNGKWFLKNKNILGLYNGKGDFIPLDGMTELKKGDFLKGNMTEHDLMFHVIE